MNGTQQLVVCLLAILMIGAITIYLINRGKSFELSTPFIVLKG